MTELNRWWEQDSAERYWMEITDRRDLGDDLIAPQVDDAGRLYWSYNLINEVRDGDVILHWHKHLMGEPSIVGWSRATGLPETATIVWQARGTAGRAHGPSAREPAWRMPLTDYTPLLAPVGRAEVRAAEPGLRTALSQLTDAHDKPLYLPFAFSDKRPVRAAQGYLVKFPKAFLDPFNELDPLPRPDKRQDSAVPPRSSPEPGDSGYITDPRVRRAIERHAVARASAYFAELGYDVEDVGAIASYDLRVRNPDEERRVEVKGSSGHALSIELTVGEVRNAREHELTDLFIVDHIEWWREPDGSISTDGGQERVLHDWTPAEMDLAAARYRYNVPERW